MRLATLVAAVLVFGAAAQAQQRYQPSSVRPPFDQVEINTTDLGNRIYMLDGEGANITVAVSDDGVIMVDIEFAELNQKIKAAIAALTDLPIRYLIITHFHRDHTGGNAGFAQDGAIIVAHENVKTVLEAGSLNGLTGNVVPPASAGALPQLTYTDAATIYLENHTARLMHEANWHTDGDTQVYFPEADVLVTGDVVTFGLYPNIDVPYGGNIDGMIEGVETLLQLANDNTKIVPGHGPVGNKAMMVEYRQMLLDARDRIAQLIADGMTEDEAVAARPNADYDAALGASAQRAGNFVRVVYRSLKN
jgi:glyoxylase-like metal-dependent hydrolase (beta-lactamase superfamily II)